MAVFDKRRGISVAADRLPAAATAWRRASQISAFRSAWLARSGGPGERHRRLCVRDGRHPQGIDRPPERPGLSGGVCIPRHGPARPLRDFTPSEAIRQLGRVVGLVCGRRAWATIGDAGLPRGLKQAIFNTETERVITESTEKARMALRARCRWRAIRAVLWPIRLIRLIRLSRTADAAVLLRGPLCTSFCLRGKISYLLACRRS